MHIMSNNHKTTTNTTKHDKHDESFIKHVEKSTYIIEHDIAELPEVEGKVHDLAALLKKTTHKAQK